MIQFLALAQLIPLLGIQFVTQISIMGLGQHMDPIRIEKDVREYTTSSADEEAKRDLESGNENTQDLVETPFNVSNIGLERWNKPQINVYRYLATLYSFIIMGMNDAAYGVSLSFLLSPSHDLC